MKESVEYSGVSRDPVDGRGKAPSSPVEPIVETVEPVVEEKPKLYIYILKEIVKCPDCNLEMTQHTLKYIHKQRGFCKAVKTPEPEKNTRTNNNQRLHKIL